MHAEYGSTVYKQGLILTTVPYNCASRTIFAMVSSINVVHTRRPSWRRQVSGAVVLAQVSWSSITPIQFVCILGRQEPLTHQGLGSVDTRLLRFWSKGGTVDGVEGVVTPVSIKESSSVGGCTLTGSISLGRGWSCCSRNSGSVAVRWNEVVVLMIVPPDCACKTSRAQRRPRIM